MQDYHDHLTISTPEAVDVVLDLAGPGTRISAGAIDLALQGLVGIAGALALYGLNGSVGDAGTAIIGSIGIFLLLFFYTVAWELLNDGRPPGKALLGLRVVRDDGRRIDGGSSMLRNVLRLIELPLFYAPGIVLVAFTARHQRIGDIVAGTLVVHEPSRSKRAQRRRAKREAEQQAALAEPWGAPSFAGAQLADPGAAGWGGAAPATNAWGDPIAPVAPAGRGRKAKPWRGRPTNPPAPGQRAQDPPVWGAAPVQDPPAWGAPPRQDPPAQNPPRPGGPAMNPPRPGGPAMNPPVPGGGAMNPPRPGGPTMNPPRPGAPAMNPPVPGSGAMNPPRPGGPAMNPPRQGAPAMNPPIPGGRTMDPPVPGGPALDPPVPGGPATAPPRPGQEPPWTPSTSAGPLWGSGAPGAGDADPSEPIVASWGTPPPGPATPTGDRPRLDTVALTDHDRATARAFAARHRTLDPRERAALAAAIGAGLRVRLGTVPPHATDEQIVLEVARTVSLRG